MRELWSIFVVKCNWSRPNLIHFNNCLKDKTESHEQIRNMQSKPKVENLSKTKAEMRVLPQKLQLGKSVNIHLEYSASSSMPCGSALCLTTNHIHSAHDLRKTHCACPAYKQSGSVLEHRISLSQDALGPIVS